MTRGVERWSRGAIKKPFWAQPGKDLVHQGCVSLSVDQCSREGWGTFPPETKSATKVLPVLAGIAWVVPQHHTERGL